MMTEVRYLELETGRNECLTYDEMVEGYHFCPNWDFMLIGPDMPEYAMCLCDKGER